MIQMSELHIFNPNCRYFSHSDDSLSVSQFLIKNRETARNAPGDRVISNSFCPMSDYFHKNKFVRSPTDLTTGIVSLHTGN
jgi:hypothetical protein